MDLVLSQLNITGPVPVAGVDLLLILPASNTLFKDIFLVDICQKWIEQEHEDHSFGEYHHVDSANLEMRDPRSTTCVYVR